MGAPLVIQRPIAAARLRAGAATAAWCVGICIGWNAALDLRSAPLLVSAALVAALALACVALSRSARRVAAAMLLLAVTLAGAGWSTLRLRESPADAITRVADPSGPIVLRLTLLEPPRLVRSDPSRPVWIVRARSRGIVDADARTHAASGVVWLRVPATEAQPAWSAGDRVLVRGTFRPIQSPRNPGEFDMARWARDRAIEGSIFAPASLSVRPDESPASVRDHLERTTRRTLSALRVRAHRVVDEAVAASDPATGQLVRGLLLGEDPDDPLDAVRAFYRVGLAHILTISGFHLAVFAGAVLFVVRLCGDLGRLEPLIVAACVGLFLVIVPPGSPTVRAAVIVIAMLAASLIGRRYDRLTILLWTALLVLIARPSELWSLGFQLSFGLTAALIGLTPQLQQRLFPPRLGRAALRRSVQRQAFSWWRSALAASLVCWLVSAPWLVVQLGAVNPLALVTGLVVTPVIAVLLWFGYAAVLVGVVLPSLAIPLGRAAATLADAAGALVIGADAMPGAALRLPWVSPVWGLCTTALIVVWLARPRLRRATLLVLAIASAVWLGLELALSQTLPRGVGIELARLDAGPRRCVLVRTPDSATLIDTGGISARGLAAITRELGAAHIDTLVLDEPTSPATREVILWLRPTRVLATASSQLRTPYPLAGIPVEPFPSLAAALENLGLAGAEAVLARTPEPGVQILRLAVPDLPAPTAP